MVDRFLVWLSAGIVATGLSAATLAGAGVAIATEGAASDGGGTTSSDTSNSSAGEADSDADATDPSNDESTDPSEEAAAEAEEEAAAEAEEEAAEEEAAEEDAKDEDEDEAEQNFTARDSIASEGAEADVKQDFKQAMAIDPTIPAEKVETRTADTTAAKKDVQERSADPDTTIANAVVVDAPIDVDETPDFTATALASAVPLETEAAATAPPFAAVLDLIGTVIFNLYGFLLRTIGGPPVLPPNSTVTVRSSTLVLECGCNDGDQMEVPADWYIPAGAEENPPDKLIYLQHGFLAMGPWYSHTAAALAEQTGSIVVAPSIWSNFFASDGCWLGAPPMHKAIADLFAEGNTALADSALAAGYSGPVPDRVVLIGHSLGGGAVAGTSGNMVRNGSIDRLAGVIMLDGVPFDEFAAENLGLVPDDIPIYQLAAPKYFWNQFGVGTDALLEARPDDFIGVTLVGGSHVDSMRGGNPLIQFSQQLVSGFSKPQNVDAARMLMIGWVTDMFAGNKDTGIYLDRGEEFVLDTPSGQATLVDLPNTLTKPFILNFLRTSGALGGDLFVIEPACASESLATGSCTSTTAA